MIGLNLCVLFQLGFIVCYTLLAVQCLLPSFPTAEEGPCGVPEGSAQIEGAAESVGD